jgi:hypothetical protein
VKIFEMMWSEGRDVWWSSRGPDVKGDVHGRMLVMLGNVPTGDYGDWKLPFLVQR